MKTIQTKEEQPPNPKIGKNTAVSCDYLNNCARQLERILLSVRIIVIPRHSVIRKRKASFLLPVTWASVKF